MPTYNYQCEKCENIQEEFHRMSEKPEIICNKCKSKKINKCFSTPQINMNNYPGTGLHETDNI
jgi:putative FmdB family regulatory protein